MALVSHNHSFNACKPPYRTSSLLLINLNPTKNQDPCPNSALIVVVLDCSQPALGPFAHHSSSFCSEEDSASGAIFTRFKPLLWCNFGGDRWWRLRNLRSMMVHCEGTDTEGPITELSFLHSSGLPAWPTKADSAEHQANSIFAQDNASGEYQCLRERLRGRTIALQRS